MSTTSTLKTLDKRRLRQWNVHKKPYKWPFSLFC